MSAKQAWINRMNKALTKIDDLIILELQKYLESLKFADRVQLIQKLLKLAVEALDGMEAEVAREVP